MKNLIRFLAAISAIFISCAAGAVTDTTSLAQAAGDGAGGAMHLAQQLFGDAALNPLQSIVGGGTASVLQRMFGVINSCIMIIAAVFVGHSMISGVLMTAHDGEFLGKKMNSVWVPLRMSVGIGSLVPIAKGFCLAQFIMLWCIQMGIGVGNLTWTSAIDFVKDGGAISAAPSGIPSRDLALQVFQSRLCVNALNLSSSLTNSTGAANWINFGKNVTGDTISYGSGAFGTECGSYLLPQVVSHKSNGVSASNKNTFDSLLTGSNNALYASAEAAATAVYAQSFNALDTDMDQISIAYVQKYNEFIINSTPLAPFDVASLDAATAKYNQSILSGIASVQTGLNGQSQSGSFLSALKADSVKNGFINAGAWYMTLGTSNSVMQDALSKSVAVIASPQPPQNFVGMSQIYSKILAGVDGQMPKSANASTRAIAQDGSANESYFFTKLSDILCQNGAPANLSTTPSIGQCFVDGITRDSSAAPAIVRISAIGNSVTFIGASIISAAGAVKGFKKSARDSYDKSIGGMILDKVGASAGVRTVVGTAEGVLDEWLAISILAAQALLMWGLYASIWIPLIPAVIWIGAVAALLAVWVEAVVAAPLWAFAHLSTEGEGVGEQAQHGYLFIMNVLFRPCLMVVGFVLGSIMVDLLTEYVLALYPTVIANASVDSWTGLLKIAGYITALCVILNTVVSLSFSMIRVVPDQVLGWIGGNSSTSVGSDTETQSGGGVKAAFAVGGKGGGGGGKSGKDLQAHADKNGSAGDQSQAESAKSTAAAAAAGV